MPPKRRTFTPEQKRRRALAVRRWQAKMRASGRCYICGAPRMRGNRNHCKRHAVMSARIAEEYKSRNRKKVLAGLRARAAKRRAKAKAARIAAGEPPRAWIQRNPRKPLKLRKPHPRRKR